MELVRELAGILFAILKMERMRIAVRMIVTSFAEIRFAMLWLERMNIPVRRIVQALAGMEDASIGLKCALRIAAETGIAGLRRRIPSPARWIVRDIAETIFVIHIMKIPISARRIVIDNIGLGS